MCYDGCLAQAEGRCFGKCRVKRRSSGIMALEDIKISDMLSGHSRTFFTLKRSRMTGCSGYNCESWIQVRVTSGILDEERRIRSLINFRWQQSGPGRLLRFGL